MNHKKTTPRLTDGHMHSLHKAIGSLIGGMATDSKPQIKCVAYCLFDIKTKIDRKTAGGLLSEKGYILTLSSAEVEALKYLREYFGKDNVEVDNCIVRLLQQND